MRFALILAAFALPMPLLAQSADPQPEASPSPEAKQKDEANKLICRREISGESGIVVPRKRCHTQAQWDYIDKAYAEQSARLRSDTRSPSED